MGHLKFIQELRMSVVKIKQTIPELSWMKYST